MFKKILDSKEMSVDLLKRYCEVLGLGVVLEDGKVTDVVVEEVVKQ